ncbi:MAG: hypothetical protein IKS49_00855 [Actinomycetaceae bacterium]|nr:hypothetical protein [Actinomycetaceae bacterium]
MKKMVALVSVLVFLLALSSTFGFLAWKHGKDQETKDRVIIHESSAPSPTPETTSPSAPANPEETEVRLSANEQYEANIFLSNFVEVQMTTFEARNLSTNELVQFAVTHHVLNTDITKQTSNTLSLQEVNKILDRYFGRTLSETEAATFTGFAGDSGSYSNGVFSWNAPIVTNGNALYDLAIVDRLEKQADGTFRASFRIWRVSSQYGLSANHMPYSLTPEEAAASSELDNVVGSGVAVMRPHKYKDRNSYQIISYQRNE